jgi:uncharacterized DUF497 family protein
MRFRRLEAEWDEDNVEHISRHGVEPEEIEEIVYEECHPSWIGQVRGRRIREPRWVVLGQTCDGRYLLAIVAPYPQRGVWRAVTARDLGDRARRRYQQWRKN